MEVATALATLEGEPTTAQDREPVFAAGPLPYDAGLERASCVVLLTDVGVLGEVLRFPPPPPPPPPMDKALVASVMAAVVAAAKLAAVVVHPGLGEAVYGL